MITKHTGSYELHKGDCRRPCFQEFLNAGVVLTFSAFASDAENESFWSFATVE